MEYLRKQCNTFIFIYTDKSFRSRTPIPETSDDEGLKDNEVKVEADIEDKGTIY